MGKNYIEGDLTLFTETPEFAHCGLEDMMYMYKGFHDFIILSNVSIKVKAFAIMKKSNIFH